MNNLRQISIPYGRFKKLEILLFKHDTKYELEISKIETSRNKGYEQYWYYDLYKTILLTIKKLWKE